jgi:hypothetical protein
VPLSLRRKCGRNSTGEIALNGGEQWNVADLHDAVWEKDTVVVALAQLDFVTGQGQMTIATASIAQYIPVYRG